MPRPLEGLKILDFTTLLPGPYATQLLADMGAQVLRLETPSRPDLVRSLQPRIGADNPDADNPVANNPDANNPGTNGDNSISAAHATLHRNKQTIALNLKEEQGKDIVHKLIEHYDIVIEQFRPGVMQRLGLDYDSLRKINPQLIYCSISGYGQTGPLKDRAGHDINYLALSGLASLSGRKDTGPVLSGTQIADIGGGSHHAVMGILAAVIQRQTGGIGQHIDISMSDAALALTSLSGASYLAGGKLPGFATELLNGGFFYGYYQTLDQRYFSIGSLEPKFAQQLFDAIDRPEWATRLADSSPQAQAQLSQDIGAIIASKCFADWQARFAAYDACIEPVLTLDEVKQHPHFLQRQMFIEVPHTDDSQVTQIASPLKFSASTPQYKHTGARLGADTDGVLLKYGFSKRQIAQLREKNIVF